MPLTFNVDSNHENQVLTVARYSHALWEMMQMIWLSNQQGRNTSFYELF